MDAPLRSLVAVFVLFVGLFFLFQMAGAAFETVPATENATVTNETVPQNFSVPQPVEKRPNDADVLGFDENVTVYNSSDVELNDSDHYDWNATNATIVFNDTAKTDDTENASITYNYTTQVESARDLNNIVAPVLGLGKFLPFAGLAMFVLTLVVWALSRSGSSSRGFSGGRR